MNPFVRIFPSLPFHIKRIDLTLEPSQHASVGINIYLLLKEIFDVDIQHNNGLLKHHRSYNALRSVNNSILMLFVISCPLCGWHFAQIHPNGRRICQPRQVWILIPVDYTMSASFQDYHPNEDISHLIGFMLLLLLNSDPVFYCDQSNHLTYPSNYNSKIFVISILILLLVWICHLNNSNSRSSLIRTPVPVGDIIKYV